MVKGSDKMGMPGGELPKDYREIVEHLVRSQGWRYDNGSKRGGHPMLYPADVNQRPLAVPTTPGEHRALNNWRSEVRKRGGQLPSKKGGR